MSVTVATEICFYGRYNIVSHQVMVALWEGEGFYIASDLSWNDETGDHRKVIVKWKG